VKSRKIARLAPFTLASVIAVCPPVASPQAAAPSDPASFSFTAATIKPSDPNTADDNADIGFNSGCSLDAKAQTLKEVIAFAYNWRYYDVDLRIIGGPKWIGTDKFDLQAKCDEETARAFAKLPLKQQIRAEQPLIQELLADRFKLRLHHETRLLPAYALVLARGGSKMRPAANPDPDEPDEAAEPDGPPGQWEADGATMEGLANQLSTLPEIGGKIVVDMTGLKGKFDFALKWTADPTMGAAPPGSDSGVKPDPSAPSLLTALQEQLGLKLELSKEPVDVLVVDSVALPSPN
jgi:uncharacterized protein (TIGR03435 family)